MSNYPFNQQHLDFTDSHKIISQAEAITHRTVLPKSSSSQDVRPLDASCDLSSEQSQESYGFRYPKLQNDIFLDHLKPKEPNPKSFLDDRKILLDQTSAHRHVPRLWEGQSGIFPNEIKSNDFQLNRNIDIEQHSLNRASQSQNSIKSSGYLRQQMTSSLPKVKESLTGTRHNPQVEEDFRLAQTIANRGTVKSSQHYSECRTNGTERRISVNPSHLCFHSNLKQIGTAYRHRTLNLSRTNHLFRNSNELI